jgi:uncharacterized protein (TIGR03437 family)
MLASLFVAAAVVQTASPANLAISTYLKDGFTPSAIASDAAGNVYLAGSGVIDPVSQTMGAVVAKLDPKASQFLYLTYFDSAANDQLSSITVDSAGNAYVAGWTTNPNFPNTGTVGTAPTSITDTRAFVAKLSPAGAVVLSALIGGSTKAQASGVAVTPQGQILVSGLAGASGFPQTSGAYSVADSTNQWFLMELNAGASQTIFSATGIGGSSIALDPAGNIYLAGSSGGTDYPTTPGAYQTTFVQGTICYGVCQFGFNGNLQHITKVDAAASKLIYSTGLNDPTGRAGSTTNTGLAIDAAGNAYVTGTLLEASYPFTVKAPTSSTSGYLSKLDPTGANLLFSVPIGGAGVELDSSGALYVGGIVSSYDPIGIAPPTTVVAPAPEFSWIPQQCLPDNITAISAAYVMKVDPTSGSVLDSQWIDGSAPGATGIALADGKIWITGETPGADVPFTPNVLAPQGLGPGFLAGGYLSAVDFSGGVNPGPAIACVLDGGNLTHVGPVAAFQLLSIFGTNLGPTTGVAATDGTASLGGVSITFDGNPAQLLYVSSTQINVAVPSPPPSQEVVPYPNATVMQLKVNNITLQRQFPLTVSNMNLFATLTSNEISCTNQSAIGFQPVATNADGSPNSCTNPAKLGSTVSFFMHGVGAESLGFPPPQQLFNVQAFVGQCVVPATNASLIDGFVYKVDVSMPPTLLPCATSYTENSVENSFSVTFNYDGETVGPREIPPPNGGPFINFTSSQPLPMIVWVTK